MAILTFSFRHYSLTFKKLDSRLNLKTKSLPLFSVCLHLCLLCLSILDVRVLVVREPVAELLVVEPLVPEGEVEHGEGGVAGDVGAQVQERRHLLAEVGAVQGCVRLQEHQVLREGGGGRKKKGRGKKRGPVLFEGNKKCN